MAGNRDDKYFESFVEMVGYSCEAAELLQEILEHYDPDEVADRMLAMHEIEHAGDIARHVMTKKLLKEFIAPIEREDIMALADAIDNVTDKVEDVLLRMYMFNIRSVNEDAIRMAHVIVKCCDSLRVAIEEFQNFRKSKTLQEKIIEINHYEEEADAIFQAAVRTVFTTIKDPIMVEAWYHTLHYMEDCCDACEDAADVIESVILKNS